MYNNVLRFLNYIFKKCKLGTYVEKYIVTDFGINSHCHNNTANTSSCSISVSDCPWKYTYSNFTICTQDCWDYGNITHGTLHRNIQSCQHNSTLEAIKYEEGVVHDHVYHHCIEPKK